MTHICLFQTAYYLYCCVYTPHLPSLLKHCYLYCSTLRNICPKSVSYMSVERGQVTTLWWLYSEQAMRGTDYIFKDPRVLCAFSSAMKQNGVCIKSAPNTECTGVCHDDTITSINETCVAFSSPPYSCTTCDRHVSRHRRKKHTDSKTINNKQE